MKTLTLLISIGGPTCSGKTLLVKSLKKILPEGDCFIIHQDDYAPPESSLPPCPTNPDWADWDHPPTAINYPLFLRSLRYSKKEGKVDERVGSHDHLNEREGGLSFNDGGDEAQDGGQGLVRRWRERFEGLKRESEGRAPQIQTQAQGSTSVEESETTGTVQETSKVEEEEEGIRVVFGLVDGFLLYWDERCTDMYDVSFFLRVPRSVLRERRETRATYVTQTGDTWTDPPEYHPLVVWPAYQFGHRHMFTDGNVENGELIRDMDQWKKDEEQIRGGWAEEWIKKLDKGTEEKETVVDKGKGKQVAGASREEREKPSGSRTLHEFRPREGQEGLEEMVDEALSLIFDAVRSVV